MWKTVIYNNEIIILKKSKNNGDDNVGQISEPQQIGTSYLNRTVISFCIVVILPFTS